MDIYIGIDLAWGEKNLSGFCVLTPHANKLKILDIKLVKSIDEILQEILLYKEHNIYVGIDAPLVVPNKTGNRDIEKNFNKDFSKYKISMLPANRDLLTKYTDNIRSEELFLKLSACGFKRDYNSSKVVFEVYTHSTIAVCFNNYKILPYKRKKGRNTEFIKEQLDIYKKYLLDVISPHAILQTQLSPIKGAKLKEYEDMLDSLACGYAIYYCQYNKCKFYSIDREDTFVTPI
ncbi:DUF429 domain-containing protein [Sulfurimonas sp.]